MTDPIDASYELFLSQFIGTLTDSATDAVIDGELAATRALGIDYNFNLVSSRAVEISSNYRTNLERFGGSEITQMVNGRPTRVFEPWLSDAVASDKQKIAEIIQTGIKEGTPLSEVEKQLDGVFAMREANSKLAAYQETKTLYNAGSKDRYQEENIQRGRWVHMDPQEDPREEHMELDGNVYDLDDPIWDELNLPNCHCRMEPVLSVGREE